MNKRLLFALLLVIAAVGVLAASCRGEERRVRKVFAVVEEELSKSGPEAPIAALRKARTLAALTAPVCRIVAPEAGFNRALPEADDRIRAILTARQYADSVDVRFDDLQISFTDDEEAMVSGDISILGNAAAWGFSGVDARELVARLRKNGDGEWQFTSIALRPILSR